jgi:ribosome biogenesis SPOUT family RNA methylase Rps3
MALNKNTSVKDLIGEPIAHYEKSPVKGSVNIIKGNADLEFTVHGTKSEAKVVFKGKRMENCDFWESKEFVVKNDKATINL